MPRVMGAIAARGWCRGDFRDSGLSSAAVKEKNEKQIRLYEIGKRPRVPRGPLDWTILGLGSRRASYKQHQAPRLLGVKARLADGPHLEADLSRRGVVDDVAAVEDEGLVRVRVRVKVGVGVVKVRPHEGSRASAWRRRSSGGRAS